MAGAKRRACLVEDHHEPVVWRPDAGKPRFGDEDSDVRVAQHEIEPVVWRLWIERQVGAASLHDGERPDDQLSRAVQAECHHVALSDACGTEVKGETVGALVQLPVGQAVPAGHDRRRVGRLIGARRNQVEDREV